MTIDLKHFKNNVASFLFENEYVVETREFPGHPESGFGSLVELNIRSRDPNGLLGEIRFWSHGQIEELVIWSRKTEEYILKPSFFDSYKLPEAQEKIKEFIHYLLPDFKDWG